jgi:hypothetical protein
LRDGRLLYLQPGGSNGHVKSLILISPDGRARLLGDAIQPFAVAEGANAAFVGRKAERGFDSGVWRVPLDDRDESLVIPGRPGLGTFERDAIAASSDGQLVAASNCGEPPGTMDIIFRGQTTETDLIGQPVGFDRERRLIFRHRCRRGALQRLDVTTGAVRSLSPPDTEAARVTPDSAHAAVLFVAEGGGARLQITDTAKGDRRTIDLPGDWALTRFGGDRYVVLEGAKPGDAVRGWRAAIDLESGSITYLPPFRAP